MFCNIREMSDLFAIMLSPPLLHMALVQCKAHLNEMGSSPQIAAGPHTLKGQAVGDKKYFELYCSKRGDKDFLHLL